LRYGVVVKNVVCAGGVMIGVVVTTTGGTTTCDDTTVTFCTLGVTVMIVGGTVTTLGGRVTVNGGGVNVDVGGGVVVNVVAGAEMVVPGWKMEEVAGVDEEEDERPTVPEMVMAARDTEDSSATRFHFAKEATAMYVGTVTKGTWTGGIKAWGSWGK